MSCLCPMMANVPGAKGHSQKSQSEMPQQHSVPLAALHECILQVYYSSLNTSRLSFESQEGSKLPGEKEQDLTLASHFSPAARKASRWQAQSKGLRRDTAGLGASGVETLWAKGTQEGVGRGKMEPGSVPPKHDF